MNYKVLYRKYRPDCFDNLVGQDAVKTILKNSIIEDKISHAYIFAGPRGTGKTSTAKIFARAINCENNKNGEACGKCVSCENFSTNTDIIEIDAASNNGVDQIREITNNIKLAPTMSKYKVYIIDEVHMLSQSAFNALLLTLEEPPSHVIFILATTNIENVPITILSRCQRFDFKKISIENIIDRLTFICDKEKIKYDTAALEEIAYVADGGLRDALSILDQLSKSEDKITLDVVIREVGTVSMKSIEKIVDNLEKNDSSAILKQINEYRTSSLDYKLIIKKIIDMSVNKAKDIIAGKKSRLNFQDYKNLAFDLTDCLNKININVDAYSLIELTLLNYINLDSQPKKEDPVLLIAEEKKDIKEGNINGIVNIRVHNCFVSATKDEKNRAQERWSQLIEDLDDLVVKPLIMDTEVVLASEDIIVLLAAKHTTEEINDKSDLIASAYKKVYKKKTLFVALNKEEWKKVSSKYVEDHKAGIKYEIIKEPKREKDDIEKVATNLFDSDKIEIL